MAVTRIEKKISDYNRDYDRFAEWLNDLRCYLIEADHENIDPQIIVRQFKRKFKRMRLRVGSMTRFPMYVAIATDRS